MTLNELEQDLYRRLGFAATPDPAVTTRMRAYLNQTHREILSQKGLAALRQTTLTAVSVAGDPFLTLTPQVSRVITLTDRAHQRVLVPVPLSDLRDADPGQIAVTSIPHSFAVIGLTAPTPPSQVTKLQLYPTPQTIITYHADVELQLVDMTAGTEEPRLPTDFAWLLTTGALMKEWQRMEKTSQYDREKVMYRDGLGDLKMFVRNAVQDDDLAIPSRAPVHGGLAGSTVGGAGGGVGPAPGPPLAHATTHQPGGSDPMAVDAAPPTGSLRTLGPGANQAAPGNDARFNSPAQPTAHASTHDVGGGDPMAVDRAPTVGSLRTLGTGANQAAPGNDTRFTALPQLHAPTHKAGGTDPVKLDELAAPTDITTLNATASAHGLLPKLPASATVFLDGTGNFTTPVAGVPGAHHASHEPGGADALVNVAWTNLANTFSQNQTISRGAPMIWMNDSGAPADARMFRIWNSAQNLTFDAINDAMNLAQSTPLYLSRAGDAVVGRNLVVGGRVDTTGFIYPGNVTTGLAQSTYFLAANSAVGGLYTAAALYVGGALTVATALYVNAPSPLVALNATTTTNYAALQLTNAAGTSFVGIENSAGTNFGATPYSLVLLAPAGIGIDVFTNATKRLAITWAGEVCIGTSGPVGSSKVAITANASVNNMLVMQNTNAGNTGTFHLFVNSAGGVCGSIAQTAVNTVAFATTSDQRFKTDRGLATDVSGLRAVAVHDFDWTGEGRADRGIFAQETHPVFPRAVVAGSDLSHPWMADYSKFVPDLIVGWQQHDDRLAKLEALLRSH